jgi:L-alanine-DL-glutamate epimerase-like enolase superfamily enzyme
VTATTGDKVADIRAYPLSYPEPHYRGAWRCVTIVRIESAAGHVGWGEAISQLPEATLATVTVIDRGLAGVVLGSDPTNVDAIWQRMGRHAYWYGVEGIAGFAISAIDMALWDLAGKITGQPVAQLLGGKLRDAVPAMGSIIFDMDDLDWTLAEFQAMREQGYPIMKAGWGMRPEAMFGQRADRDLAYLTAIRELVGSEPSLVVDVPGAQRWWDLKTAIRRLREWERFDLRWVEQPLHPAELEAHRILRAATATPVGTGEDEWSPESYGHVIDAGAADVVQLDPGRCLGLSGARRVVAHVERAGLNFSMHSWSGALNTAASLHLLATSTHGDTLDFKPHPSPMQHELTPEPWTPVDGHIVLRDRPGLGVDIDESALARYALEDR